MLEQFCVICGKERYKMTNAVTCGSKECQKAHNRNKMREYQRSHRSKLRASLSNAGICDCCNHRSISRRTVEHSGQISQLCVRCHKAIDAIHWDKIYFMKLIDTLKFHLEHVDRAVRAPDGRIVTTDEEKATMLAFWASRP